MVSRASAPNGRQSGSRLIRGSGTVSAPSSVGVVTSNNYFRMDGQAQKLTEFSGMGDCCRVVGCDLFSTQIQAGSTTATAGFGGTANYTIALAPHEISARLTNLEELFQFYAIRKLGVQYIPNVGTATAVSVALGLAQDIDTEAATITTQQQVLEFTPSVLTPAWQSSQITYTHTGVKVWETSTENSAVVYNAYQGAMWCVLLGSTASTVYGQLRFEYVIDFYKPSPILASPSLCLKCGSTEIVRRPRSNPCVKRDARSAVPDYAAFYRLAKADLECRKSGAGAPVAALAPVCKTAGAASEADRLGDPSPAELLQLRLTRQSVVRMDVAGDGELVELPPPPPLVRQNALATPASADERDAKRRRLN